MANSIETPLKTPDVTDRQLMSRRAWWLIVLNFLIPGLPQLLVGHRRLGRIGLTFWLLLVAAAVAAGISLLSGIRPLTGLLTNSWVLLALQVAVVLWTLVWILLTVDTFRTLRLGRARRGAALGVSLLTVVALVAGVSGAAWAFNTLGSTRDLLGKLFAASETVKPVDGRYNFLLIGGDSGAGREGLRPDSLSVVSVDAKTGSSVIVGIPRNLEEVPLGGSPLSKIYPDGYNCGDDCLIDFLYTEAYSHKNLYTAAKYDNKDIGALTLVDAASAVTGLKVQYYVMVDMAGFSDIVDALGGITVDVKQKVIFVDGPDGHLKYHGYVNPGKQHMSGQTALWYARSRKLSSDYDRMERQRQLQTALLKQFSPATLLTRFQAVAKASPEFVHTNIPQNALAQFVELAGKAKELPVSTLELVPPKVTPWDPEYVSIHQMVAEAVASASASVSPSAN
ncbi:MAG: LCP family protein [Microbacteriaceae bacterium]|jgi:LCP family protein required for cell wall assembly|nr:LCP family protein [Microbacteriaceae bacterium]MCI1206981.1 LCP family protein [Microbacteriaceae bacterium]